MTNSLKLLNATLPETEIVPIIIDAETSYYSTAVLQVLSSSFSVLGIVANIFNIIVFVRQGAKSDSTSAGLLGLAAFDLIHLVSSLWLSMGQVVILYGPRDLFWIPGDMTYIFAAIPNYMSAQNSKMATAYVALQRCICVVFPFKVKSLFTSRRTFIVFIVMFTVTGLSFVPFFVTVYRLGYRFDPLVNRTRLGVVGSPGYQTKVNTVLYANNVAFTMGSVATVLICTTITVYQLKLSKNWRESVSAGTTSSKNEIKAIENDDDSSSPNGQGTTNSKPSPPKQSKMQKEKRLMKVIISISVIFLITYCFNLIYLINTYVNPHARIFGKNHNMAQLLLGIAFLVETINSSINIVVYYTLSSSYKEEIRLLFGLAEEKKK